MTISNHNRNFLAISGLIGLSLAVTLALQLYHWPEAEVTRTELVSPDQADVEVRVGEMYFEQIDSNLPRGQLEAQIGQVIAFYNEGRVPHTVTIDHFGIDEVLEPEESMAIRLTEPGTDIFINCRFHGGHEASLTVTGDGVEVAAEQDQNLPTRGRQDRQGPLEYKITDNGVKEFHLTIEPVRWQYAEEEVVKSWGYNGQLPGPEIRLTEGDEVRIRVENHLPEATTVHWHGVDVPFETDGVPGLTQAPIEPEESFIYEFTAEPAGTRFYHSHGSHHGNEGEQLDRGLAGPLIIEPADYEPPDVERTLVLSERRDYGLFPIDGSIYPEVKPIQVNQGDRVRLRLINAGSSMFHPMHLHGHQFRVVAVDGNPIPEPAKLTRNNLPIHPGETYDIEFLADNPGDWLFHCHELDHARGGMIVTVEYTD